MSGELRTAFADDLTQRRRRKGLVSINPRIRGVDWVELVDVELKRLRLKVYFLPSRDAAKSAIPPHIGPANFVVTSFAGGARFQAEIVHRDHDDDTALLVDVGAGLDDLGGAETGHARLEIRQVDDIDPLFACADFSLRRQKLAAIDPLRPPQPLDVQPPSTSIDYLAKDYQSFVRLMLDHMATLAPGWHERHAADIGMVLVETLAYAADYLSYYQDAVATEAYLSTARRRTSVRRHARLLDYRMHEGCVARTWLHVQVIENGTLLRGFRAVCDEATSQRHITDVDNAVPPRGRTVFETSNDVPLWVQHNSMPLYDWGIHGYRLPAGAISAMLEGKYLHLAAGDVLIFSGGSWAAAHAVRLVADPRVTTDPVTDREITEIVWDKADALPADLDLADNGTGGEAPVILGNIVPIDAGATTATELLTLQTDDRGRVSARLRYPNLVYRVPYSRDRRSPASAFGLIDPADAVPAIEVTSVDAAGQISDVWVARPDLLDSERFACEFVAETDEEGMTTLRFGDGVHGLRPPPGTRLLASYRVCDSDYNVGARAIGNWDRRPADAFVVAVSNPLPASGGADRETLREVRRDAPEAFRQRRQCVVAEDFVALANTDPRVQGAVAQTRWIGSRHTVFVYVQQASGVETDHALLADLDAVFEAHRIIGSDVVLSPPSYVPLQIALTITVRPQQPENVVRREVVAAIEQLYRLGRPSFGEPVYLSSLIACAMGVPGVTDVRVEQFHRLDKPPLGELRAGRIDIGATEIARLDNQADNADGGQLIVKAVSAAAVMP